MSSHRLTTLGLSVFLAGLIGVSTVVAQGPEIAPWTTVGSAGTVEEVDLPNIDLGAPVAGAVSIRSAGTVRIRYNVVAVAGVLGGNGLTLTARYQAGRSRFDNGSVFFFPGGFGSAQVVARLIQYNLHSGALTTLLTLDSNSFPPASGFQVQSVSTPGCFPPFTTLDFVNNSYFVDVSLIKVSGGPLDDISIFSPKAALGMIKLTNNSPCIL